MIPHIRQLFEASTKGQLSVHRYEHGGGRFYLKEPNQLIADFYDEANRELFDTIQTNLSKIIKVLEASDNLVNGEYDGSAPNDQGSKLITLINALNDLKAKPKQNII